MLDDRGCLALINGSQGGIIRLSGVPPTRGREALEWRLRVAAAVGGASVGYPDFLTRVWGLASQCCRAQRVYFLDENHTTGCRLFRLTSVANVRCRPGAVRTLASEPDCDADTKFG
jgi:hypothetical protein